MSDDFESGFNEAVGIAAPVEDTATPEEVEVVESTEPEVQPEPEVDATPAEPEALVEDVVDYKTLFEKEQQRFKSLEGRFKAEMERRKTVSPPPVVDKPVPAQVDDSAIQAFKSEFPDLATPIETLVQLEARRIMEKELAALREQEITPVRQALIEQQGQAHVNAILRVHPDATEITESGELKNWIDTLPGFMQAAAIGVYEGGSTTEVIELYNQFKAANRKAPESTSNTTTTPQHQAKAPPLAVPGKPSRAVPKPEVARNSFEAGWMAATKEG